MKAGRRYLGEFLSYPVGSVVSSFVCLGIWQVQGLGCQNSHNKSKTERGIFLSLALGTLLLHQYLPQGHFWATGTNNKGTSWHRRSCCGGWAICSEGQLLLMVFLFVVFSFGLACVGYDLQVSSLLLGGWCWCLDGEGGALWSLLVWFGLGLVWGGSCSSSRTPGGPWRFCLGSSNLDLVVPA